MLKNPSNPHPKCVFQSVGVVEGILRKASESAYLIISNDLKYKVSGFPYQVNKRWQARLSPNPEWKLERKLLKGDVQGYWLVYPEYISEGGRLYLAFQVKKRLATHDKPGLFNVQGSIYKQKPSETILAVGRNKGQPRWIKPRTIPVKGALKADRFELWHFNLALQGYQFHIETAEKVSDNSPYIRLT